MSGGLSVGSFPCLALSCLASFALLDPPRCIAQGSPLYVMSIPNAVIDSGAIGEVPVIFDNAGGNVDGWTLGVCHDPGMIELLSAVMGATTEGINGGYPPDFHVITVFPNGYTQGAIVSIPSVATLPPGTDYELAVGIYTPFPFASGLSQICLCNTLGLPLQTVVAVGGQSFLPVLGCGAVLVTVPPPPPPPPSVSFVRGDANVDGLINVADPIWLLGDLFGGGPHTECDGANDANDDGTLNIADVLFLLAMVFGPGQTIPAYPYPECGATATAADCTEFAICP